MDVKERAEKATAHIKDPIERARRCKALERALRIVETDETEKIAEDDGKLDGVPVRKIKDLDAREDARLRGLRGKRDLLFDKADFVAELCDLETPVAEIPLDSINKKGKLGYTRIMQAIADEDIPAVRQLLNLGADLTITDNGGMTPLMKAKMTGNKIIIALLHEFGG